MKQFVGIIIVALLVAPVATAQDQQIILRGITVERPTSMPQLPADLGPRQTGTDIIILPNTPGSLPRDQDTGVPNPGPGCPPPPAWCAYVTNPLAYPACGCSR